MSGGHFEFDDVTNCRGTMRTSLSLLLIIMAGGKWAKEDSKGENSLQDKYNNGRHLPSHGVRYNNNKQVNSKYLYSIRNKYENSNGYGNSDQINSKLFNSYHKKYDKNKKLNRLNIEKVNNKLLNSDGNKYDKNKCINRDCHQCPPLQASSSRAS